MINLENEKYLVSLKIKGCLLFVFFLISIYSGQTKFEIFIEKYFILAKIGKNGTLICQSRVIILENGHE